MRIPGCDTGPGWLRILDAVEVAEATACPDVFLGAVAELAAEVAGRTVIPDAVATCNAFGGTVSSILAGAAALSPAILRLDFEHLRTSLDNVGLESISTSSSQTEQNPNRTMLAFDRAAPRNAKILSSSPGVESSM